MASFRNVPVSAQRKLLTDGLLEGVYGGLDPSLDRHRQIFHFEGDDSVIADHVADREEFLPPLQILATADCNIVPGAVLAIGNRFGFQQAVDITQSPLDSSILAVDVVDRFFQSPGGSNRIGAPSRTGARDRD